MFPLILLSSLWFQIRFLWKISKIVWIFIKFTRFAVSFILASEASAKEGDADDDDDDDDGNDDEGANDFLASELLKSIKYDRLL